MYPLIFALSAEEVEEVDDDAGHHQDLQVVILPVCSLRIIKKQFRIAF
jgi:hypothetical protein